MATLDREREAGGLGVQLEQASKSLFERGGLDLTSAKGFEAKLWEAIRASSSGVILDLGGVTFIDSIGLRILISASTLAHGGRRELIVV